METKARKDPNNNNMRIFGQLQQSSFVQAEPLCLDTPALWWTHDNIT